LSEDFVFLLYLRTDPLLVMSDSESGLLYSLAACLTFFYGILFAGYLIDIGGVKLSLSLGSFFLFLARLTVGIAPSKVYVYISFATLIPLGMSLCNYL